MKENVNQTIKDSISKLVSSNKRFEDIFDIMFSFKNNILCENRVGGKIFYHSYHEVYSLIKNFSYSFNNLYPSIKHNYVGLYMDNSLEWIVAFWGILGSGNIPFLINTRLPKEMINKLLSDLEVKKIVGLVDPKLNKEFVDFKLMKIGALKDYVFHFENEIALCTSGTTLESKIVLYTGEELSNQILNSEEITNSNNWIKKHYKGSLKLLAFLPFYHIFGLVATYFWFCFFGRTIVFLPSYSSNEIINTINVHKVTHIFGVPLLWETIEKEVIRKVKENGLKDYKKFLKGIKISSKVQNIFPNFGLKFAKRLFKRVDENLFGNSVYFCISGGSYIKDSTLKTINALGYPLYNGYGSSEIGITSVELRKKYKYRISNGVGKPFSSIKYDIDFKKNLIVSGSSLAKEVVIDGKFQKINNRFDTLDQAHVDEYGNYYIDGRDSDIYIGNNGENINPDLIEKKLNFVRVKEFTVLGFQDKLSIVVSISKFTNKDTILNIIKTINEYNKSVKEPYYILQTYFTYDSLKRIDDIKVSRKYVIDKIINEKIGVFPASRFLAKVKTNQDYKIELVELIKDIVSKVLCIDKDKISNDSNIIFDLGASSLDYISIISEINKTFDINVILDKNSSFYTPNEIAIYIGELL